MTQERRGFTRKIRAEEWQRLRSGIAATLGTASSPIWLELRHVGWLERWAGATSAKA